MHVCAEVALHSNVAAWPIATLLGFNCRLIAGFAAVAASALLSGTNESCWPQAASAAIAAHPATHLVRFDTTPGFERPRSQHGFRADAVAKRLLRPSKFIIASPLRFAVGSGNPPHMSKANRHNVDAWIVIRFCKLSNLSPIANVAN
jgi:hypothetical protein